jgi:predicted esterase
MLSRRQLLALSAAAGFLRCTTTSASEPDAPSSRGRIDARPATPVEHGGKGMLRRAGAVLYVPQSYEPRRAVPLIVLLHGAGGGPEKLIQLLTPHADRTGTIVVAPKSLGQSWDLIAGRMGPDVERIDDLLEGIFSSYSIDPKHVCVSGFSDGASYALTLGIANGDLFTHVIAFSPGFASGKTAVGAARYFISHGTRDQVLPIDRCGRRLAAELKRAGFDVEFLEFDGTHAVPPNIVYAAMNWFTAA